MSLLPNLDSMTDEEKLAALESIHNSINQSKEIQKKKVAENVNLVLQALKRIEADMLERVQGSAQVIENRVNNIKDGKDGINGRDGKDGKDGRPGRDGKDGRNGRDGLQGLPGADGQDGVGVSDAHIDFDGSLIITLTNGNVINVGEVVAPDLAESIKVISNGGGTSQGVLDTLTSLQTQITALQALGATSYQGTWNASTNTPTITSSVGTKGYYYVVSVAGSTSIDSETRWGIGDWIIFNGSVWQKVDGGSTGNLTDLTVSNSLTLSGGTANGVGYLDGSKVFTTSSNLFWDSTNSRLGLANSSPAQRLDVTGSIRAVDEGANYGNVRGIYTQRTGNDTSLYLGYRTTPDAWVIAATYQTTGAYKPIAFATSDTERMRLDNSGNLLIGTTTAVTGSKLVVSGADANINGLTVGLGGGSVSSNTVLGNTAFATAATGANNVAIGFQAVALNTSGAQNTSVGTQSLTSNTTGSNNVSIGYQTLNNNTTGGGNNALGRQALFYNTIGSNNTAVGYQAAYNTTSAVATLGTITGGTGGTNGTYTGVVMTRSSGSTAVTYPTATIVVSGGTVTTVTITSAGVGFQDTTTVLTAPTASIGNVTGFSVPVATLATGTSNAALGYQALYSSATGTSNTAIGTTALYKTTGSNNTGLGYQAGYNTTTGTVNTFIGNNAGFANVTGSYLSYVGASAGIYQTGNYNNAFGYSALNGVSGSSTGTNNNAFGYAALNGITTGSSNTAMGHAALLTISTASNNTAIGYNAGYNTTGGTNVFLGYSSGSAVTSGASNVIIGGYTGSAAPISATGSNYIVLSDGAGNVRQVIDSSGNVAIGATAALGSTSKVFAKASSEPTAIGNAGTLTLQRSANDSFLGIGYFSTPDAWVIEASYSSTGAYKPIVFATSDAEKMRLDTSGRLLINTTATNITSSEKLTVNGLATMTVSSTSVPAIYAQNTDTTASTNQPYIYLHDGTANRAALGVNYTDSALVMNGLAGIYFRYGGNGMGTTEGMRLNSSGNLLVGTTTQQNSALVTAKQTTTANSVFAAWNATTTGDAQFIWFGTEAGGTTRGSITYNRVGGLTAYNTTSDYRAKDILGVIADSGKVIDSVPVYMGKMKGAEQERPMFIAHETPAYAHTGEKDAVDVDGNPVYQQMDASALVPVMWAEIQSLRKRLAAAGIA